MRQEMSQEAWSNNFYGSGCLFTDGNKVLAGSSFKMLGEIKISGLGGKREGSETPIETAWREVLEEIFDWRTEEISDSLLAFCFSLEPLHTFEKNNYICFIFSFTQLEQILEQISVASRLYKKIPRTIGDLVFDRIFISHTPFEKVPEISQILVYSLYAICPNVEFYSDIVNVWDLCQKGLLKG